MHDASGRPDLSHADDKKAARIDCISHLLSLVPYQEIEHAPVDLPQRERHPDYARHPIQPGMIVPNVFD
jgi:hypothetical protein